MKNKNPHILEGSIAPTMFKLALPMIFGIFFILFFILVDVFFIAKLGADELAAVSFTIPIVSMIDSLILGFGVATAAVIARMLGANEEDKAKQTAFHAIVITFVCITILCVIGMMTVMPLFNALGANDTLLPLIDGYMFYAYLGLISLVPPLIGNSVMRGSGNTMIPALTMLTAAIINAILDPILIFGLFGFPRLEMEGAAIATIIARLSGFVLVLWFLKYKFHLFTIKQCWGAQLKNSIREILDTAIPAGAANMIPAITATALTAVIAQYGPEAVSAFGVAARVELLFYVPFFGMAAALAPFVGQNWGAENYTRIKRAVNVAAITNIVWGVFAALILMVFGEMIIKLFSDDPQTIDGAMMYFGIVPLSYCAVGLVQVTASYFNSTARPRKATLIPLTQFLVLILPMAYIGQQFYGLKAVFVAICLANLVAGIGFFTAMRRKI